MIFHLTFINSWLDLACIYHSAACSMKLILNLRPITILCVHHIGVLVAVCCSIPQEICLLHPCCFSYFKHWKRA